MFSIILTWIGAMLGVAVLLAMAFGAFILDFDDARADRNKKKTADAPNSTPTTAP